MNDFWDIETIRRCALWVEDNNNGSDPPDIPDPPEPQEDNVSSNETFTKEYWMKDIVYGNNKYMILIQEYNITNDCMAGVSVLVSSDASTWTKHPITTDQTVMDKLLFMDGYFYAITHISSSKKYPYVYKSNDGVNWTIALYDDAYAYYMIDYETGGTLIDDIAYDGTYYYVLSDKVVYRLSTLSGQYLFQNTPTELTISSKDSIYYPTNLAVMNGKLIAWCNKHYNFRLWASLDKSTLKYLYQRSGNSGENVVYQSPYLVFDWHSGNISSMIAYLDKVNLSNLVEYDGMIMTDACKTWKEHNESDEYELAMLSSMPRSIIWSTNDSFPSDIDIPCSQDTANYFEGIFKMLVNSSSLYLISYVDGKIYTESGSYTGIFYPVVPHKTNNNSYTDADTVRNVSCVNGKIIATTSYEGYSGLVFDKNKIYVNTL